MNERLDKELHYIYFLPYRCIKYQNISKQSQSVGIQQYQVTISNRNLLTTDIAQYLICTQWLMVPGSLVDTQLSVSQMVDDQTSGDDDTWVHMCFQRTKSKISDHLQLNKHPYALTNNILPKPGMFYEWKYFVAPTTCTVRLFLPQNLGDLCDNIE